MNIEFLATLQYCTVKLMFHKLKKISVIRISSN